MISFNDNWHYHLFMTLKSQSGNVLVYILIAVALLAALSYVVAQNSRGVVSGISEQRAKLYATEIITYANSLADAVSQLRLRGCRDTEISFERPPFDGSDPLYTNPNSPSDFSCHVFHVAGGAVGVLNAPDGASTSQNEYDFREIKVEKLGQHTLADVHLLLPDVDLEVCKALNKILSNNDDQDNAPINRNNANAEKGRYFKGSYIEARYYVDDGVMNTKIDGNPAACLKFEHSPGVYYFYFVLLVR